MKKDEKKQIGQTVPCPIQQEAARLVLVLTEQGNSQLLAIVELVIRGQYAMALTSVKMARVWASRTPELFSAVKQLVYATMCPHAKRELEAPIE